jgi:transcription initiation factor TFIIIB Brf1 subunit/transcription initiation factor TFIIB
MNCPKCNSKSLTGEYLNYTTQRIVCLSCGLSHDIGAQKESLIRQATGHNPKSVEQRKALLQVNKP